MSERRTVEGHLLRVDPTADVRLPIAVHTAAIRLTPEEALWLRDQIDAWLYPDEPAPSRPPSRPVTATATATATVPSPVPGETAPPSPSPVVRSLSPAMESLMREMRLPWPEETRDYWRSYQQFPRDGRDPYYPDLDQPRMQQIPRERRCRAHRQVRCPNCNDRRP